MVARIRLNVGANGSKRERLANETTFSRENISRQTLAQPDAHTHTMCVRGVQALNFVHVRNFVQEDSIRNVRRLCSLSSSFFTTLFIWS